MLKIKKWLVLLLALICLSTLFACSRQKDSTELEEPLPETDADDVAAVQASASVECCDGEITLRFMKDEQDKWIWKDDEEFPLDENCVAELIAAVEHLLTLSPLENPKELVDYDLDGDEEKYVSISGKDGTILWYLGDQDSADRYYMRRSDQDGLVYLAPAELTDLISRSIYDMAVLPKLPALTVGNMATLCLTDDEGTEIVMRSNGQDKWVDSQGTDRTAAASSLMAAFARPELSACVDFRPSSGADSICGLKKPQATMVAEYTNSLNTRSTLTVFVGKAWKDGYYGRINDDTTIYLLPAELVEPILAFFG